MKQCSPLGRHWNIFKNMYIMRRVGMRRCFSLLKLICLCVGQFSLLFRAAILSVVSCGLCFICSFCDCEFPCVCFRLFWAGLLKYYREQNRRMPTLQISLYFCSIIFSRVSSCKKYKICVRYLYKVWYF